MGNAKTFAKITGGLTGVAVNQLRNKNTYLAAGCVGLGAAIGSKNINIGIQSGVMGLIAIVGCAWFNMVPVVVDRVLEEEENESTVEE